MERKLVRGDQRSPVPRMGAGTGAAGALGRALAASLYLDPAQTGHRRQLSTDTDQIRRSRIRTSVTRWSRLASSRWIWRRAERLRSRSRL